MKKVKGNLQEKETRLFGIHELIQTPLERILNFTKLESTKKEAESIAELCERRNSANDL